MACFPEATAAARWSRSSSEPTREGSAVSLPITCSDSARSRHNLLSLRRARATNEPMGGVQTMRESIRSIRPEAAGAETGCMSYVGSDKLVPPAGIGCGNGTIVTMYGTTVAKNTERSTAANETKT